MTEQEFLTMMDEILDTGEPVKPEAVLDEIEEWDSLAFVSFIAMANTAADKKVDRTAVQKAKTVSDLYALLQ